VIETVVSVGVRIVDDAQDGECSLGLVADRPGGFGDVVGSEGSRTPMARFTRGAGSPAAALAMVFKLVESVQERWRAITGAHLVALVRSGARFENGVLVERTEAAA
jgi:hypothetical protein